MNREIKFRAWYPYDEKSRAEVADMDDLPFENASLGNMYYSDDYQFILNNGRVQVIEEETKPMAVMQYTGLKDRNGKEIYEGDIVSCDQCQGYKWKVKGVVHYGIENREDWPDPRVYLDTRPFEVSGQGTEFCFFHKNPEIIGDIYQNPELLTN